MGTVNRKYHKGDIIFKEGKTGDCCYVVKSGRVEVFKMQRGKEVKLAELCEYEFFGEMSLLDPNNRLRSASVRAIEDSDVIIMSKEMFQQYLGQLTPGIQNLIRTLVIRLRKTNAQLRYYQDKEVEEKLDIMVD
ncbi:MAG TPA: cyclic nucleotide-binding domain-containing protein [archaeon]|nr:cyclic nucleotide-binding domain-containing protein [archaeon]